MCYVGYDLELEKKLALETTTVMESYTLPDGRVIKARPTLPRHLRDTSETPPRHPPRRARRQGVVSEKWRVFCGASYPRLRGVGRGGRR